MTAKEKEKILLLRWEHMSCRRIARDTGFSAETVAGYLRKLAEESGDYIETEPVLPRQAAAEFFTLLAEGGDYWMVAESLKLNPVTARNTLALTVSRRARIPRTGYPLLDAFLIQNNISFAFFVKEYTGCPLTTAYYVVRKAKNPARTEFGREAAAAFGISAERLFKKE